MSALLNYMNECAVGDARRNASDWANYAHRLERELEEAHQTIIDTEKIVTKNCNEGYGMYKTKLAEANDLLQKWVKHAEGWQQRAEQLQEKVSELEAFAEAPQKLIQSAEQRAQAAEKRAMDLEESLTVTKFKLSSLEKQVVSLREEKNQLGKDCASNIVLRYRFMAELQLVYPHSNFLTNIESQEYLKKIGAITYMMTNGDFNEVRKVARSCIPNEDKDRRQYISRDYFTSAAMLGMYWEAVHQRYKDLPTYIDVNAANTVEHFTSVSLIPRMLLRISGDVGHPVFGKEAMVKTMQEANAEYDRLMKTRYFDGDQAQSPITVAMQVGAKWTPGSRIDTLDLIYRNERNKLSSPVLVFPERRHLLPEFQFDPNPSADGKSTSEKPLCVESPVQQFPKMTIPSGDISPKSVHQEVDGDAATVVTGRTDNGIKTQKF